MTQLTNDQALAAYSIDKNVLVSAGAGSGKTAVLVERFISILRENRDISPAQIIAVTFTRKAAQEMTERIKIELERIISTSSGEEQSFWRYMRAEMDKAKIGTIHSLCDYILRLHPAEAQVDPLFKVLDDLESERLILESIDGVLEDCVIKQTAEQILLSEYSVDRITGWLKSVCKSQPRYLEARQQSFLDPQHNFEERFQWLSTSIVEVILNDLEIDGQWKHACTELKEISLHDLTDKQSEAFGQVKEALAAISAIDLESIQPSQQDLLLAGQQLIALSKLTIPRAGKSPASVILNECVKAIKEIAKKKVDKLTFLPTQSDQKAVEHLRYLDSLILQVFESYGNKKKLAQRLDFNDLVSRCYQLVLAENSQVRQFYHDYVRAILVDEFQDTNAQQAELLLALAGQKTRLFLIGDDKQSIYRFQGADVSVFNHQRRQFSSRDEALVISLKDSFRSQENIVRFVNQTCRPLFASNDQEPFYRARFEGLIPTRKSEEGQSNVQVMCFDSKLLAQEDDEKVNVKAYEADLLARWILAAVENGQPIMDRDGASMRLPHFGDIAILVQDNSNFLEIETALSRWSIPYVSSAGKGFFQRQEILDLISVLEFLFCPQNELALFSLLRSPMFSLSDDNLHRLKANNVENLWYTLQKRDEESRQESVDADSPYAFAVSTLRRLLSLSGKLRVDELIRKVINDTNYDITITAMPNGKQRSRNVFKFITICQQYSDLDLADLLSALEMFKQAGTKQSDAPLELENAVRLMTMHGSKGLEFPVVILPCLSTKVLKNPPNLLFDRSYGMSFKPDKFEDEEDSQWYQMCNWYSREMDIAERKRLLYVAMTRARERLFVLLDLGARNDVSFNSWLKEVLNAESAHEEADDSKKESMFLKPEDYQDVRSPANPIDEISLAELDLSMLDVVDQPKLETSFKGNWQQVLRVSLSAKQSPFIEPTILGILFHKAMEKLNSIDEKDYARSIENLAMQMGVVERNLRSLAVSTVCSWLELYKNSNLLSLQELAVRQFHEYVYVFDGRERRVDLLLEMPDSSLYVIDFKTDLIAGDSELASKISQHRDQVNSYVQDLSKIMDRPVQGYLYFAGIGKLLSLDVEPVLGSR